MRGGTIFLATVFLAWAAPVSRGGEADADLVPLLESDDDDLRCRAAVALLVLKSPGMKRLGAWLSRDRHSLELAGWAMLTSWNRAEAKGVAQEALKTQPDEPSRKRIQQFIDEFDGKKGK